MKKLANHIILSGVTVSMLFSPLMAIDPNKLPSGGKFTHGTSGSISGPYFDKNTGKNTIDITGKTQGGNHVIQWGGGFSIGNKAQVNFIGNDQNYLNIAHGTDKSTIEGVLNAGGNNVFLINPNGVIITKTGTINANRFVASTTSLQAQHFEEFKAQGASFSPIFKSHKAGNVVNMGNINANDVLLIGNKVSIDGGHINGKHNEGVSDEALKNPSGNTADKIHLVGNYINLDLAKINFNSKENLISAGESASVSISTEDYYNQLKNNKNDPFKKYNFQKGSYEDVQSEDIKQYASIGSDRDWFFFAKSWNEDDTFKLVDKGVAEYRLIGKVDFKGSQGQNYANYCIDGLGCTSMIVNYFTGNKTFDGQGFTLSDINIDIKDASEQTNIGLFGAANGATFKNVKVDYKKGGINVNRPEQTGISIGSFIGYANNSKFENIEVNDVNNFKATVFDNAGGFVGLASNSNFYNIALDGFSNIDLKTPTSVDTYFGGFVGELNDNAVLENISLKGFENIKAIKDVGGFIGRSRIKGNYIFKNISINLKGISSIVGNVGGFAGKLNGKTEISNVSIDLNSKNLISDHGNVGGFAGYIYSSSFYSENMDISSIYIKNISKIYSGKPGNNYVYAGGFAGQIDGDVIIKNIILDNIKEISADKGNAGGFAGSVNNYDYEKVHSSCFSNISINGIKKISSGQGSAGGFIGFIGTARGGINFDFNNIALNFKEEIIQGKEEIIQGKEGIIQGKNGAASFIGRIDNQSNYDDSKYHDTKLDFSNIHIYFDPNFSMQSDTGKGKFVGYYNPTYNTFNFKDKINFYANESIFNGATTDKSLWSNFTTLSPDENIFKNNTENITEAINVSVVKPKFTGPEKIPDDVEVKLDTDDLYSDVIDSIIKDITKEYFSINIHDLIKILNEYKYENMNEDQKVEFIKTYFINKSKYDKNTDLDKIARSVVQSLDFASVYQGNFSEGKLNASALKEYKNNLAPKTQKIKDDQDSLNSFLKGDLNKLVIATNNLLEELEGKQTALKEVISQYNAYVDLINANKAERDDAKLEALREKIDQLTVESEKLGKQIDEKQIILSQWQAQSSKDSNEHFVILGKFDYGQLIKPDLNEPNGEGGKDPDIKPDIPSAPDDLEFEQTASLNLIGDKALEEEEEKEIGETDGEQRLITCIVSDNFKTMNPCAVGH